MLRLACGTCGQRMRGGPQCRSSGRLRVLQASRSACRISSTQQRPSTSNGRHAKAARPSRPHGILERRFERPRACGILSAMVDIGPGGLGGAYGLRGGREVPNTRALLLSAAIAAWKVG